MQTFGINRGNWLGHFLVEPHSRNNVMTTVPFDHNSPSCQVKCLHHCDIFPLRERNSGAICLEGRLGHFQDHPVSPQALVAKNDRVGARGLAKRSENDDKMVTTAQKIATSSFTCFLGGLPEDICNQLDRRSLMVERLHVQARASLLTLFLRERGVWN